MTSMRRLKTAVTKYLGARKLGLRGMSRRSRLADADYFELFVLYEVVRRCQAPVHRGTVMNGGRNLFRVALSPSPYWSPASYFEVRSNRGVLIGLRTGLSVTCSVRATTAEVDVVLVALPPTPEDRVSSSQVLAGFECKAHRRKISTTLADGVLGKASRVWGLPVPRLPPALQLEAFAVASCSDAAVNAKANLAHENILFLWWSRNPQLLDAYVDDLVAALGI